MVYGLGWSGLYNFLKMHGLTHLSDAFFNADHVELIKNDLKNGASVSFFGPIITWRPKVLKCENNNEWGPNIC